MVNLDHVLKYFCCAALGVWIFVGLAFVHYLATH